MVRVGWLRALTFTLLAAPVSAAGFEYKVTDLDIPPGAFESLATGINDAGEVVGWSGHSGGSPFFRAWMWSSSRGLTVLPDFEGGENCVPTDINDVGVIAGDGSNSGTGGRGWRLQDGTYTVVPLLPGDTWSALTGINAAGAVAGFSDDFSPGGLTEDYFFWSDPTGLVLIPESPGQITNLGRLSSAGQVVGTMAGAGAFLWSVAGGFEFLSPPPPPFTSVLAWSVDDAGHVCGMLVEDNEKYGALYTDVSGWQPIANFALPGFQSRPERATAVNSSGVVVGWSAISGGDINGAHVAWVWTEAAGARRLDDLLDPDLHVHLRKAVDINDEGEIVAYGSDDDLPEPYRAYLLTPLAAVDVATGGAGFDPEVRLDAPVPNPSRAGVRLSYAVPRGGPVDLAIYDASGRLVRSIVRARAQAGDHVAEWDGRTGEGRPAVAGVYFARLEVGSARVARKVTVIE